MRSYLNEKLAAPVKKKTRLTAAGTRLAVHATPFYRQELALKIRRQAAVAQSVYFAYGLNEPPSFVNYPLMQFWVLAVASNRLLSYFIDCCGPESSVVSVRLWIAPVDSYTLYILTVGFPVQFRYLQSQTSPRLQ
jgi:hypothetical protein